MQKREEDHTLDRRIKYIEGKFRKPGTNFFTQQKNDGSTLEITDKIILEKVIITENLNKYHHNKGAFPFIDDSQLYLDLGAFGEGPQVKAVLDDTYFFP